MRLSDIFNSTNRLINKKAKLLVAIQLDDGESREIGDEVYVVIDKGHGNYHIEDNEFACEVTKDEIEFL